uniref:Uncharacterized protein n=1 Tax=Chromera velia CCMP2878 TaxID=1169474 RepID=A0A0G4H8X5_9ALVE|eukprot:Cvel_25282.t1-p1 / transcript=Cvel_25282.t1 / gene=Cvel_25282 / organism=Chromera_velia_CCMP2878 / gene_product=hypothetical protein / transcript_product=hypothetical protein / location=Cvel_scaffold2840:4092-12750(+) / protein_length=2443 / sequence_SO=supercontig / SO=protein_coding / is_pseudo=false
MRVRRKGVEGVDFPQQEEFGEEGGETSAFLPESPSGQMGAMGGLSDTEAAESPRKSVRIGESSESPVRSRSLSPTKNEAGGEGHTSRSRRSRRGRQRRGKVQLQKHWLLLEAREGRTREVGVLREAVPPLLGEEEGDSEIARKKEVVRREDSALRLFLQGELKDSPLAEGGDFEDVNGGGDAGSWHTRSWVDARSVARLFCFVLQVLYHKRLWVSVVGLTKRFNEITGNAFTASTGPLAICAQREVLELSRKAIGETDARLVESKSVYDKMTKVKDREKARQLALSGQLGEADQLFRLRTAAFGALRKKQMRENRALSRVAESLDATLAAAKAATPMAVTSLINARCALSLFAEEKLRYISEFEYAVEKELGPLLCVPPTGTADGSPQGSPRGVPNGGGSGKGEGTGTGTEGEDEETNWDVILGSATAIRQTGKMVASSYRKAVELLRKAKLNDLSVQALLETGNLLWTQGDSSSAAVCWSDAVDVAFQTVHSMAHWRSVVDPGRKEGFFGPPRTAERAQTMIVSLLALHKAVALSRPAAVSAHVEASFFAGHIVQALMEASIPHPESIEGHSVPRSSAGVSASDGDTEGRLQAALRGGRQRYRLREVLRNFHPCGDALSQPSLGGRTWGAVSRALQWFSERLVAQGRGMPYVTPLTALQEWICTDVARDAVGAARARLLRIRASIGLGDFQSAFLELHAIAEGHDLPAVRASLRGSESLDAALDKNATGGNSLADAADPPRALFLNTLPSAHSQNVEAVEGAGGLQQFQFCAKAKAALGASVETEWRLVRALWVVCLSLYEPVELPTETQPEPPVGVRLRTWRKWGLEELAAVDEMTTALGKPEEVPGSGGAGSAAAGGKAKAAGKAAGKDAKDKGKAAAKKGAPAAPASSGTARSREGTPGGSDDSSLSSSVLEPLHVSLRVEVHTTRSKAIEGDGDDAGALKEVLTAMELMRSQCKAARVRDTKRERLLGNLMRPRPADRVGEASDGGSPTGGGAGDTVDLLQQMQDAGAGARGGPPMRSMLISERPDLFLKRMRAAHWKPKARTVPDGLVWLSLRVRMTELLLKVDRHAAVGSHTALGLAEAGWTGEVSLFSGVSEGVDANQPPEGTSKEAIMTSSQGSTVSPSRTRAAGASSFACCDCAFTRLSLLVLRARSEILQGLQRPACISLLLAEREVSAHRLHDTLPAVHLSVLCFLLYAHNPALTDHRLLATPPPKPTLPPSGPPPPPGPPGARRAARPPSPSQKSLLGTPPPAASTSAFSPIAPPPPKSKAANLIPSKAKAKQKSLHPLLCPLATARPETEMAEKSRLLRMKQHLLRAIACADALLASQGQGLAGRAGGIERDLNLPLIDFRSSEYLPDRHRTETEKEGPPVAVGGEIEKKTAEDKPSGDKDGGGAAETQKSVCAPRVASSLRYFQQGFSSLSHISETTRILPAFPSFSADVLFGGEQEGAAKEKEKDGKGMDVSADASSAKSRRNLYASGPGQHAALRAHLCLLLAEVLIDLSKPACDGESERSKDSVGGDVEGSREGMKEGEEKEKEDFLLSEAEGLLREAGHRLSILVFPPPFLYLEYAILSSRAQRLRAQTAIVGALRRLKQKYSDPIPDPVKELTDPKRMVKQRDRQGGQGQGDTEREETAVALLSLPLPPPSKIVSDFREALTLSEGFAGSDPSVKRRLLGEASAWIFLGTSVDSFNSMQRAKAFRLADRYAKAMEILEERQKQGPRPSSPTKRARTGEGGKGVTTATGGGEGGAGSLMKSEETLREEIRKALKTVGSVGIESRMLSLRSCVAALIQTVSSQALETCRPAFVGSASGNPSESATSSSKVPPFVLSSLPLTLGRQRHEGALAYGKESSDPSLPPLLPNSAVLSVLQGLRKKAVGTLASLDLPLRKRADQLSAHLMGALPFPNYPKVMGLQLETTPKAVDIPAYPPFSIPFSPFGPATAAAQPPSGADKFVKQISAHQQDPNAGSSAEDQMKALLSAVDVPSVSANLLGSAGVPSSEVFFLWLPCHPSERLIEEQSAESAVLEGAEEDAGAESGRRGKKLSIRTASASACVTLFALVRSDAPLPPPTLCRSPDTVPSDSHPLSKQFRFNSAEIETTGDEGENAPPPLPRPPPPHHLLFSAVFLREEVKGLADRLATDATRVGTPTAANSGPVIFDITQPLTRDHADRERVSTSLVKVAELLALHGARRRPCTYVTEEVELFDTAARALDEEERLEEEAAAAQAASFRQAATSTAGGAAGVVGAEGEPLQDGIEAAGKEEGAAAEESGGGEKGGKENALPNATAAAVSVPSSPSGRTAARPKRSVGERRRERLKQWVEGLWSELVEHGKEPEKGGEGEKEKDDRHPSGKGSSLPISDASAASLLSGLSSLLDLGRGGAVVADSPALCRFLARSLGMGGFEVCRERERLAAPDARSSLSTPSGGAKAKGKAAAKAKGK